MKLARPKIVDDWVRSAWALSCLTGLGLFSVQCSAPSSDPLAVEALTEETRIARQNEAIPTGGTVQHVTVHYQSGQFYAWPTNHGIWIWGNEVLVGYSGAPYTATPEDFHHNAAPPKTYLARSRDGGLTWETSPEPVEVLDQHCNPMSPPSTIAIDFARPGFAMKLYEEEYWLSADRGETWDGPHCVPGFGHDSLSGRTGYVANQHGAPVIFMSVTDGEATNYANIDYEADDGPREPRPKDVARTLVFTTDDRGQHFREVSWVSSEPNQCDLAMPPSPEQRPDCPLVFNFSIQASPVRLDNGDLLVALRERTTSDKRVAVFRSFNDGADWERLSDPITAVDNPGALVALPDARLAIFYVDRQDRTLWAKLSEDRGNSWGEAMALSEPAYNDDIGYSQAVLRPDGKVLVVYYFSTEAQKEQHIRATIWAPPPPSAFVPPPERLLSTQEVLNTVYGFSGY